jgi:hypothetical protein
MARRRKPVTAREKILSVIRWADQQEFHNVAAELRDALARLPDDGPAPRGARR